MFSWLKTSLLMAAIMALFGVIGGMIGGYGGMMMALAFGGIMNFFAYWFSGSMVLKMYKAREVDETISPYLYRMVKELAGRAQLPMPKVYLIDDPQPNAFATGRNRHHAAVAATTGILHLLSERELRGVMAHELAHVRNNDILISTIAATVAGAISSLAQFAMFFGNSEKRHPALTIIIAIFAPLAAMMIQMAISRTREYAADRGGAEISGDPEALANALAKIEHYAKQGTMPSAEQHPETAQMMIINPLRGGSFSGLFSTHPATAERIRRLKLLVAR